MIRVLAVDDHRIVREGVKRLLAESPDIRVTAEATSGAEALAQLGREPADIVLLDVAMPETSFVETLRDLRERYPKSRVIVLSGHAEEEYAVRALKAGASGYVAKLHSSEELIAAIRKAQAGGTYVSAALAERLARDLGGPGSGPAHDALSDRELEVLRLLGQGRSVKEIAAALDLSSKTVSTYRTRMLEKLRLKSTADLIRYAVEHGL